MRYRWHSLLLAVLLFTNFRAASADQNITLSSGETVKVLGIGLMHFDDETALTLKYRTKLPLNDRENLRKQVDAIWNEFVVNVEKHERTAAIIMAIRQEKGFIITRSESQNFVFLKRGESWRTLEVTGENPIRLDESKAREFIRRLDWADSQNKMNALLLYMADDWSKTVIDLTAEDTPSRVVDRHQYAKETYNTLNAASSYRKHRDIHEVQVDSNGRAANIQSTVNEEVTIDGTRYSGVVESTDFIELKDRFIMWTRSESTIQGLDQTKVD